MSANARRSTWRAVAAVALLLATSLAATPDAPASAGPGDACQNYLVPQHTVAGYRVGETSCQITTGPAFSDSSGRPWAELDLAISGTAAGYVDTATSTANFRMDLTDVPAILYPQFGIPTWTRAQGAYSGGTGTTGAGISVLYPADPAAWNGGVAVLMHGQANNTPLGAMPPQGPGQALPSTTFDQLFAPEWVDAGWAVIYVRRPAASGVTATTSSGQTVPSSLNDNINAVLDWLATGRRVLAHTMGRAPSITLAYGHSAGTIWGELENESGFNTRPDGSHVIDGFVWDDPGGGMPLPLSMPQGQVLGVRGPTATYPPGSYLPVSVRAQMVPGIVLAHADYVATHTWLPGVDYLDLKQEAQQLFDLEGLGDRTRTYVIAGVSHVPASTGAPPHTLDYGPLIQAIIPMLSAWVTRGAPPPPSIVGPPGDTSVERQLRLPPISCPTGIRYPWPYPSGAASQTGYAAYGDGSTLEPVDSQGALVDIDANGYRDRLPSLDAAWRSLHLIGPGRHVTGAAYARCVADSATALERRGLLTAAGVAQYISQAQQYPNVP